MGLPDVPLNIHWFMTSFPIKTVIDVFVACFSVLTDPQSAEWIRNCWFCGVGAQKYMQWIAVLRGTTWPVMVRDAEIWLGTIAILLVMKRVCLQMREFNPQPFLWELTIGITVGVPYFQTNPSVMNVLFCPLCLASSSNARTYHGLYSTQVLAVFWGSKSSHKKPSFYLGHPGVMAPVRGSLLHQGESVPCGLLCQLSVKNRVQAANDDATDDLGWC